MEDASLRPRNIPFHTSWECIEDTVNCVLGFLPIEKVTWNSRFSDIYALCIAYPEPLADRLYYAIKSLLEEHVKTICKKIEEQTDGNILSEYFKHWGQFSKGAGYLNILFLYLNTHHIEKTKCSEADITYGSFAIDLTERLQEIGELALDIWKTEIILPLKTRLVRMLLQGIKQDRDNISTDSPATTIHSVIMSFLDVHLYKQKSTVELYEEIFEKDLVKETDEFYRNEAAAMLQTCTVSEYMAKVLQRLHEEKLRATKFLPPSSHVRIERVLQSSMVAAHLATLHAEAPAMVAQEASTDLSNLYSLIKPVSEGLNCLIKLIQEHIKEKGLQAVANLKGDSIPLEFVENLLSVHSKYTGLMRTWFYSDSLFTDALDKAFEKIINHRTPPRKTCASPELLARYSDLLLKKSTKGLSEMEVDEKLCQSITLFKYIDDKDVFQKFYSRFLARRLIQQQSQSMDSEEAMINKLKHACGYEYTSKLHRMYTDVSVSQGLNQQFTENLQAKSTQLGINFNIMVLQAGAWPMGAQPQTPFNVPQELEKSLQEFEEFYHRKFSGRKLNWIHNLCQGELKCSFSKKYFITLSTYQMAMLLMFQKVDAICSKEIQRHTGLTDDQYIKYLQSLIDCKIFVCDDQDLQAESMIKLNLEYTNKRTRFKITVAAAKETQQEVEQTHSSVEEDRKHYLQAAIVRIMKARKVLKHNSLIQEVIEQSKSRFIPQIPMIKKCIEALIEKQYLERAKSSADEYSYCA